MNARLRPEDLAAFGEDLYPDVAAMSAERRELFRLTAQRMVVGSTSDPHALKWAQQVLANTQPLNRPMSTGEPT